MVVSRGQPIDRFGKHSNTVPQKSQKPKQVGPGSQKTGSISNVDTPKLSPQNPQRQDTLPN